MSKRALWITGFIASLGIPYFSLDGNLPQSLQNARSQWLGSNSQSTLPHYELNQPSQVDANATSAWHMPQIFGQAHASPAQPLTQQPATPVVILPEALRHELTPQWVMSRWPTAVAVNSEPGQLALRVPLITGYESFDVVGSLTYLFDSQQKLTRMSFVGQTQNEQQLLNYVLPAFGLQLHTTVQGQLFINQHEGHPLSIMHIDLSGTTSEQAGKRIILELNRPFPGARMSPEMRQFVQQMGNI